jgi:hypothetical protein
MHHLRQANGQRHTVLMVQVKNEVGVLPQSRDHSEVANAAFAAVAGARHGRCSFARRQRISWSGTISKSATGGV